MNDKERQAIELAASEYYNATQQGVFIAGAEFLDKLKKPSEAAPRENPVLGRNTSTAMGNVPLPTVEWEKKPSEDLVKYLSDLDNLIDTGWFPNDDIKECSFYHEDLTLRSFVQRGREYLRQYLVGGSEIASLLTPQVNTELLAKYVVTHGYHYSIEKDMWYNNGNFQIGVGVTKWETMDEVLKQAIQNAEKP